MKKKVDSDRGQSSKSFLFYLKRQVQLKRAQMFRRREISQVFRDTHMSSSHQPQAAMCHALRLLSSKCRSPDQRCFSLHYDLLESTKNSMILTEL